MKKLPLTSTGHVRKELKEKVEKLLEKVQMKEISFTNDYSLYKKSHLKLLINPSWFELIFVIFLNTL